MLCSITKSVEEPSAFSFSLLHTEQLEEQASFQGLISPEPRPAGSIEISETKTNFSASNKCTGE